jgi:hypothetical protein
MLPWPSASAAKYSSARFIASSTDMGWLIVVRVTNNIDATGHALGLRRGARRTIGKRLTRSCRFFLISQSDMSSAHNRRTESGFFQ